MRCGMTTEADAAQARSSNALRMAVAFITALMAWWSWAAHYLHPTFK
jgi:hypothetical protein